LETLKEKFIGKENIKREEEFHRKRCAGRDLHQKCVGHKEEQREWQVPHQGKIFLPKV